MRRRSQALAAAVAALLSCPGTAAADALAIVGATVVDVESARAHPNQTVLIEGERIAAVGPTESVAVPEGARVVDARGTWVVPGLVDAHVHFFQSGSPYTRPDVVDLRHRVPYEEELARLRAHLPDTLRRWLASGVTAVADLGGPKWTYEVRSTARQMEAAPHVAAAGPLISTVARPALNLGDAPIERAESPAHAAALARERVEEGADFVKLWFIHRRGDDLAAQTDLLRAVVEVAHAAGKRVVVHATELRVAKAALRAGADILAHSVTDAPVDGEFLSLARRHEIVYIPTLFVGVGYDLALSGAFEPTELEREKGSPEVIAMLERLGEARSAPHPQPSAIARSNLRRVLQAGIPVAVGSDAGNIGTLHGPGYFREIEELARAGMSPPQILEAATAHGARVMGMEDQIGAVRPGRLADLLLLDANPLLDASNLGAVHRVIRGGEVFAPEALVR